MFEFFGSPSFWIFPKYSRLTSEEQLFYGNRPNLNVSAAISFIVAAMRWPEATQRTMLMSRPPDLLSKESLGLCISRWAQTSTGSYPSNLVLTSDTWILAQTNLKGSPERIEPEILRFPVRHTAPVVSFRTFVFSTLILTFLKLSVFVNVIAWYCI